MSSLGLIDWLLCGGYLLATIGLGLWFARQQKSTEEYFVGGRRLHWLTVGLSLFAATFSALSFVGLPREAAYHDYHLLLAIMCIPLWVAPVVAWLFVPLYHPLGLTSAYEYLERRFDRRLRLLGSLLFIVYLLGWMGSVLHAVGLILQVVLGLSDQEVLLLVIAIGLFTTFYTALGGLDAVVWTDVIQGMVLVGSMLAVLVLALGRVEGGLATVWQMGLEHGKFQMFNLHFDPTINNNFWSACAYGLFVYLAAHAVAQTSVQRYQAMPSVSAAQRSMVVKALAIAAGCVIFFLAGTTLFAFYHQAPRTGFPALTKQDYLLTHFVLSEIPVPGLVGLLLAGLFAAAMGSTSSGINSLTALVACDWLPGRALSVSANRWMAGLIGIGVISAALVVPHLATNVFDIIIKIAGALLGPLLGLFVLGMLVPRANAPGTWIGLLAGFLALAVVLLYTRVSHWWYGAVTCVPTVLVGALASLLFPPPATEKVQGLVFWRQRARVTEDAFRPAEESLMAR